MAEPNPDDPLVVEISEEYKNDRNLFNKRAQAHTLKNAVTKDIVGCDSQQPKQPEEQRSLASKRTAEYPVPVELQPQPKRPAV